MTEPTLLLILKIIGAIAVGGTIGSFLGVVLHRIPRGQSIITPASHCASCNTPLKPRDLVPVISYLLNKGRCRYCNAPIGLENVMVECACIMLCLIIAITTI